MADAILLFVPLPEEEQIRIAWPTPNHHLFDIPEQFFARTVANPDYGKPGFTRDCGKRFHRGVDIAPISATATGKTTRVVFTDCATGRDYESEQPTFVPHDEVYCVYEGVIHELVNDEAVSDFGRHIVVTHKWPGSGKRFFTLYGHLAEVIGDRLSVLTGGQIGRMGQTSKSADARNWMAIAPHLHFEVWNEDGQPYDPVLFLKRFL